MIKHIKKDDLSAYLKLVNGLVTDQEIHLDAAETLYDTLRETKGYSIIGFYQDNKLLGTASAQTMPDFTGDLRPILILENIYVDAQYRRQGIGRALITYYEDYARSHNYRAVSFFSASKRKSAHRFYDAMGYCDYPVKGFKKYL